MLGKTTEKLKAGFSETLAMPVKQSFVASIIAIIIAVIALVLAVKK